MDMDDLSMEAALSYGDVDDTGLPVITDVQEQVSLTNCSLTRSCRSDILYEVNSICHPKTVSLMFLYVLNI
jgi:hypothetical protein